MREFAAPIPSLSAESLFGPDDQLTPTVGESRVNVSDGLDALTGGLWY